MESLWHQAESEEKGKQNIMIATWSFPVFAADLIQQMKSQDTKLCPYKVIQDLNQISSNGNGNLYQIVLKSVDYTTSS